VKKLSIIVSAYNEGYTLPLILEKVTKAEIPAGIAKEIGISYYRRTYDKGRKAGYKYGFQAPHRILKYELLWR